MSGEEDEGFLNRWARRKQAAKDVLQDEAEKNLEGAAACEQQETVAETPEEEFDISKLPPVDSITAGTDIRAFLSKGVPAALTQAALRRAWSADPAIRDYIGLSEYSWDFNSPGIDGFGPLDPSLNVQEMVADVFGKLKQAAAETEELIENIEPDATQTTNAGAPPKSVELRSEGKNKLESAADPRFANSDPAHSNPARGDKTAQADAAAQRAESDGEPIAVPVRRHGSALPS